MNINRRAFCLTTMALLSTTSTAFAGQSCAMTATGSLCLNGPASRIVSLDQQSTEFLLALGVQPVAVAGIENYRKFTGDQAPRLGASIADIGLSSSPNVEVIMALQPDLIVGNIFSIQKSRPLLAQIAPLAAFSSTPDGEPDQFQNMARTLRAFAALTGRQPAAESFLAQLDADISRARQRFDAAGLKDRSVILGNINAGVTGAEIMLFNANALPARILDRCGLQYAQNDARFAGKGFTVTTVEGLIAFQDADFLYMPFNKVGVDNLMATPVWRNLHCVRENRVHAVPYRLIHTGPISAGLFLRDIQTALLS